MRIVYKTTRDFLPKIIMHLVVNNVRDFFKNELLAHVYSLDDQSALLREAPEETQKRDENMRVYRSTKEALRVIGELTKETSFLRLPGMQSYRPPPPLPLHESGMFRGVAVVESSSSPSYLSDLINLDFSATGSVNTTTRQTPAIPRRPNTTYI